MDGGNDLQLERIFFTFPLAVLEPVSCGIKFLRRGQGTFDHNGTSVLGVPGAADGVGEQLHKTYFPDPFAFGSECTVVPYIDHLESIRQTEFKEHIFAFEFFIRGIEGEIHHPGEFFAETKQVIQKRVGHDLYPDGCSAFRLCREDPDIVEADLPDTVKGKCQADFLAVGREFEIKVVGAPLRAQGKILLGAVCHVFPCSGAFFYAPGKDLNKEQAPVGRCGQMIAFCFETQTVIPIGFDRDLHRLAQAVGNLRKGLVPLADLIRGFEKKEIFPVNGAIAADPAENRLRKAFLKCLDLRGSFQSMCPGASMPVPFAPGTFEIGGLFKGAVADIVDRTLFFNFGFWGIICPVHGNAT